MTSTRPRFGRLTLLLLLALSLLPSLAFESQAQSRPARKKSAATANKKRRAVRRRASRRPVVVKEVSRPLGVTLGTRDDGDVEGTGPVGVIVPTPPQSAPDGQRKPVTGGVLNGKAISKPQPPYPAIARTARASGQVTVQITVDEGGRVISASAVSGHPLLRQAAESAARQARFSPTLLSGQPVKVTGVITYNFVLQ